MNGAFAIVVDARAGIVASDAASPAKKSQSSKWIDESNSLTHKKKAERR
jgi:hypothetical protein